VHKLLFIIFFLFSICSYNQTGGGFFNESLSKIGDSISIDAFKFDTNKLKKFDINNDTILLDTSLTINKFYQFNFRRKDNFELIKPNNVGQSYNHLSYDLNQSNFPKIGYNANKSQLFSTNDVYFYDVAYPMTELLFKSVFSQGQLTDVLFTTNVNRKLNFSLSFKALRSLGKYQNSLSGSKQFTFTYNYNSEKFRSKSFYVSQKLEKHENGGLSELSLSDFDSEDPVFDERSKLSVKFDDAINTFFKRDFYSDNLFRLAGSKKSLLLRYNLHYTTVNNSYNQTIINDYYGSIEDGVNSVSDKYKFRSAKNELNLRVENLIFDSFNFGLINHNYEYFNLNSDSEKINENSNLFSINFDKKIKFFQINFELNKKINGDRVGDKFILLLKQTKNSNFDLGIKLSSIQTHPGLMYDNYISSFSELKWNYNNDLVTTNSIHIEFSNNKIGEIELSSSIIKNFFYISVDISSDYLYLPINNQLKSDITYLKLKYHKNFNLGKFSFDNTAMFQNVNQDEMVLNVPEFVFRNSFYITEKIFNNVLDIQSGFNFKIFSSFYANEYNPLISSFHVQNSKKIGNFPIVDFFINAKIRQTRLFFVFEHINSSFSGNKFFQTPSMPYRDSNFRFGLTWNLFN